ncbi:P-loop containing nucleoside triphosphate hydrolase protein, partial [Rhypophila decipiens]
GNPSEHTKTKALECHRILVFGQTGSGKTSIINKFCDDALLCPYYYGPTLDDSDRKQANVDQIPCIIDIASTCPEEYTALRDLLIREHEGFLLVYSVNSRSSLDLVRLFHKYIQREKAQTPVSICLVGNKCDLVNEERQVTPEEGAQLAAELNIRCFYETSVKNDINIEEAFHALVRENRINKDGKSQFMAPEMETSGSEAQLEHRRPVIWQRFLHYCRRSKAARAQRQ